MMHHNLELRKPLFSTLALLLLYFILRPKNIEWHGLVPSVNIDTSCDSNDSQESVVCDTFEQEVD
jgi:hypothetical protein